LVKPLDCFLGDPLFLCTFISPAALLGIFLWIV
jgi:hypothetical protein